MENDDAQKSGIDNPDYKNCDDNDEESENKKQVTSVLRNDNNETKTNQNRSEPNDKESETDENENRLNKGNFQTIKNGQNENVVNVDGLKNNENGCNTRDSGLKSKLVENLKHTASEVGLSLNGKNKTVPLLKDSKTVKKFSPLTKQTIAAMGPIIATVAAGLTSGYSAVLLPQLQDNTGPIPGDPDTASWIASMAALPMSLGCILSGWMMEHFGRRTSQLILCIPFVLGWVLISCANGLLMMLFGRFFTGLCVGLLGPLGPVFIAESTDPKYRGFFLAGVSLAIAAGILIAHIIGTFLHWKLTALICCFCPLASYVILSFVPESPTWLISKGRKEDGIKAFNWLRGYDDNALEELKGILEKQEVVDSAPKLTLKEKFATLKKPEMYKPLIIMIIFFLTCQFSGVNAVAFYSVEIMQKTLGNGMDKYLAMIIIDSVRVVMSVAACVLCRKYGRRPLAMISGYITAASLFGLSAFLILTRQTEYATSLSWIPLSLLIIYICAISIGIVPLPWIMCGEVFPTEGRGLGSGISSAVAFAAFFAVVKTAPQMLSHIGDSATYLVYGIVAAVGTTIMFFILPETKGKSLQEIESKFKGVKPKIVA